MYLTHCFKRISESKQDLFSKLESKMHKFTSGILPLSKMELLKEESLAQISGLLFLLIIVKSKITLPCLLLLAHQQIMDIFKPKIVRLQITRLFLILCFRFLKPKRIISSTIPLCLKTRQQINKDQNRKLMEIVNIIASFINSTLSFYDL